ncbi:ATPase [Streptomyces melanogenes]|nr:ATPase [Streptomyces melanogenes]
MERRDPEAEIWFARGGVEGLTPGDRQWPACCRSICLAALDSWGLDVLVDRVGLVVSELVTNALVHAGGGPVRMRIGRRPGVVRVEVTDGSLTVPRWDVQAGADEDCGRGLLLVGACGDDFGVAAESATRKTVWCEFVVTNLDPGWDQ